MDERGAPTYFCGRCGDVGEILLSLSGCFEPCDCPAATGEPYPIAPERLNGSGN